VREIRAVACPPHPSSSKRKPRFTTRQSRPPRRAFGDGILKQCGLIADPHAFSVPLERNATYVLVLASDGVWDVLSNQKALTVASAPPQGVTPAQHLTNVAMEHWHTLFPSSPRDDIGVAVGIIHTHA
jgi:serine/threonine protein phosphatase PrpC